MKNKLAVLSSQRCLHHLLFFTLSPGGLEVFAMLHNQMTDGIWLEGLQYESSWSPAHSTGAASAQHIIITPQNSKHRANSGVQDLHVHVFPSTVLKYSGVEEPHWGGLLLPSLCCFFTSSFCVKSFPAWAHTDWTEQVWQLSTVKKAMQHEDIFLFCRASQTHHILSSSASCGWGWKQSKATSLTMPLLCFYFANHLSLVNKILLNSSVQYKSWTSSMLQYQFDNLMLISEVSYRNTYFWK